MKEVRNRQRGAAAPKPGSHSLKGYNRPVRRMSCIPSDDPAAQHICTLPRKSHTANPDTFDGIPTAFYLLLPSHIAGWKQTAGLRQFRIFPVPMSLNPQSEGIHLFLRSWETIYSTQTSGQSFQITTKAPLSKFYGTNHSTCFRRCQCFCQNCFENYIIFHKS